MNANRGQTINISMGEQTSLAKTILQTAKNTGCTLNLTMANGAYWTIRGRDIVTAKTMNLGITYQTANIPTSAVRQVAGATTSRVQFVAGDNVSLGLTTSTTVKFNPNQSGKTATLYRYNTATSSLTQISRKVISSTGYVTFDGITYGGDFLILL
jgi:hypothetical protein